jgi:copper chaperone CopZ
MRQGKTIALVFALVLAFGSFGVSAAGATVTMRIEGMHCGSCASSVEKKLKATDGVEEVRVSFEKKEAWIKFDDKKITLARLREVINSTGFKAVGEKSAE